MMNSKNIGLYLSLVPTLGLLFGQQQIDSLPVKENVPHWVMLWCS
jgi:hypothetical protein